MLINSLVRIGIIRMTAVSVLCFMLMASGLAVGIGLFLGSNGLLKSAFTASLCAIIIGIPITYTFFLVIKKLQSSQTELELANHQLKIALNDVKELSGLLPICASCKKIRDRNGYWNQLESYIESHSSAQFSHGLCSECMEDLYGGEDWYKRYKNKERN